MGRTLGAKNKAHIDYKCNNCLKCFNQKNDYTRHINRTYPCKNKNDNIGINKNANDANINNNVIVEEKKMDIDICYIIQEREFIKTGENIYKIGKTKQEGTKRIDQYPIGSKIVLFLEVDNCSEFENKVMNVFNAKYNQRKDIGKKYYQGDKNSMVKDFINIKFNDIYNL